jgi:hypothetical protein
LHTQLLHVHLTRRRACLSRFWPYIKFILLPVRYSSAAACVLAIHHAEQPVTHCCQCYTSATIVCYHLGSVRDALVDDTYTAAVEQAGDDTPHLQLYSNGELLIGLAKQQERALLQRTTALNVLIVCLVCFINGGSSI